MSALPSVSFRSEFENHVSDYSHSITTADLRNELNDADAALTTAINARDAAAIGRIVLAVRRRYAESLANQFEYGGELDIAETADVAAAALVAK